jgi:hypothetical protein
VYGELIRFRLTRRDQTPYIFWSKYVTYQTVGLIRPEQEHATIQFSGNRTMAQME